MQNAAVYGLLHKSVHTWIKTSFSKDFMLANLQSIAGVTNHLNKSLNL